MHLFWNPNSSLFVFGNLLCACSLQFFPQHIHKSDSHAVTISVEGVLAEEIVEQWDTRNSGSEFKQMTADEDAGPEVEMPQRGAEVEWEDKRRVRVEDGRQMGTVEAEWESSVSILSHIQMECNPIKTCNFFYRIRRSIQILYSSQSTNTTL